MGGVRPHRRGRAGPRRDQKKLVSTMRHNRCLTAWRKWFILQVWPFARIIWTLYPHNLCILPRIDSRKNKVTADISVRKICNLSTSGTIWASALRAGPWRAWQALRGPEGRARTREEQTKTCIYDAVWQIFDGHDLFHKKRKTIIYTYIYIYLYTHNIMKLFITQK